MLADLAAIILALSYSRLIASGQRANEGMFEGGGADTDSFLSKGGAVGLPSNDSGQGPSYAPYSS